MTRPTHRLLALAAAALSAAGFAACGDDSEGSATAAVARADEVSRADLAKVTLRVGTQKDGIRAVLKQSGKLDGIPYEVDFSTFQFGPPMVEAAGADKIDLAWVGSTPPIFGAAAGSDFKIVAAVQERDRQETSVLVPKGSPVTDVKQLEGKRVAVAKGSSAHGFLLSALKRNGLSAEDVTFTFLPPADGLAAFSSGRVDAWAVWDPFVQQAEQQTGAKAIIGGEPDERGVGFQIASSKALEDPAKLAAIRDYLGRLNEAWQWAGEKPDAWAAAWSADSKLDLAVTKVAARRKASDIVPIDASITKRQQQLADLLVDQGVLPKAVSFGDIVAQGVYETGAAK
jgi:sulfonate transport system substrate-binding protein